MKNNESMMHDMAIVTDLLIHIRALSQLLVKKNIISADELKSEMENMFDELTRDVIKNSNIDGDVEQILKDLKSK